MRVSRPDLLQALEYLQAGLSSRPILEQTDCFAFKDGRIITYNDEVACHVKSKLAKEVCGAVTATPLLRLLQKLPEDELDITAGDNRLDIKGKRKLYWVQMFKEVFLAFSNVEIPKTWKPLHDSFDDAISIVVEVAGTDEGEPLATCVHIHPKWIESSDKTQSCRYRMRTGVDKPVLVKAHALKGLLDMGMTEFSETATWIHFRNPSGICYSIRQQLEDFPDLGPHLNVETSQPITLPKGLADAAGRIGDFSAENADENQVLVELRPGKLKITGKGVLGGGYEWKTVKYSGKELSMLISPLTLEQIAKKHNECFVSEDRIKIEGTKWKYVTSIGKVEK